MSDSSSPDNASTQDANQVQSSTSDHGAHERERSKRDHQQSHFEREVPKTHPQMTERDALELLQRGQPLERVYIPRLNLTGVFNKTILLRDVYVRQFSIKEAEFKEGFSLQGCHFRRTYIAQSTFDKSVSLKHSNLHFFHMDRSTLGQGLNFEAAKVSSKFLITKSTIEGRSRFWEAQFEDWIQFEETIFKGRLDLRSSICKAGLSLSRSHCHDDALFRGMHLSMKWEAIGTIFEKLIDFSKAKMHDFVYLEDIIQGDAQRWAFWNTVCERIQVKPEQIMGRLASEEEKDYEKAMREYSVLKRSYEHEHHYNYDDWAFYSFKLNERRSRRASWSRPLSKVREILEWLLLDWGCGYGTHPLKAVRAALVMIFVFAGIYTLGFHKVHPVEHFPFSSLPPDALLNQFGVSFFLSVSAFTSGFGDLKESVMDWMNIPLIMEALLGTLLWGLFIVAFGRKVIR